MKPEWIDCASWRPSAVPPAGEPVLIYSSSEGIGIAIWQKPTVGGGSAWRFRRIHGAFIALDVTHWMPLPNAPREQSR